MTYVDAAVVAFPYLADDPGIAPLYEAARTAVGKADELCRANAYGSVEGFIAAAEICPDHPVALSKLRVMVPEGPADGEAEEGEGCIIVRYAVPQDRRGMMFRIYRREGAEPEVGVDTTPLAETADGFYVDGTVEPGVQYVYRIHSIRWGVLSEEYAVTAPAHAVREIKDVTISQLPDGLRADYRVPDGTERVRVWRKLAGFAAGEGEETEIDPGDGSFEDRTLKGGETYAYLFVAEFANGFRSRGTVFGGTTKRYPDPITDMRITWDRGSGAYRAQWSAPTEAVLYRATSNPQFPGRAVRLQDLDNWLERIDCESAEGGAVFRLPRRFAHFITPVIPCGETGIVGDTAVVTNLRPLSDVTKTVEDGMCVLSFVWPEG